MSYELKLYENARLVTEVKPGMILEAMVKSEATAIPFTNEYITDNNPTGIFGYVRGMLRKSQIAYFSEGDILVHRINFPLNHIPKLKNHKLIDFSTPQKEGFYFVVGEINNLTIESDVYSIDLVSDNLLSETDRELLKIELLEFSNRRKQKEYIFKTPDGNTYTLDEILFSLEEKR